MVQNFGWLQLNILIATLFAKVYFILHSVHHIIFYGFKTKKNPDVWFCSLILKGRIFAILRDYNLILLRYITASFWCSILQYSIMGAHVYILCLKIMYKLIQWSIGKVKKCERCQEVQHCSRNEISAYYMQSPKTNHRAFKCYFILSC